MREYHCRYYERKCVVTAPSKEAAQRRAAFLLGVRHYWFDICIVKTEEIEQ